MALIDIVFFLFSVFEDSRCNALGYSDSTYRCESDCNALVSCSRLRTGTWTRNTRRWSIFLAVITFVLISQQKKKLNKQKKKCFFFSQIGSSSSPVDHYRRQWMSDRCCTRLAAMRSRRPSRRSSVDLMMDHLSMRRNSTSVRVSSTARRSTRTLCSHR